MDGLIHKKILAVMAEVGAIEKKHQNQEQHFKFRGIDDVYEALHPLHRRHGIYCRPEVLETKRERVTTRKGTEMANVQVTVRFNFVAEDGSEVAVTTLGEAQDSGDKSSAKAQSVAMKVAYIQLYAIPVAEKREERDPDYSSHTNASPVAGARKQLWERYRLAAAKHGYDEATAKAGIVVMAHSVLGHTCDTVADCAALQNAVDSGDYDLATGEKIGG